MRLPNVENAIVEERKLSGYLLAFDHPEGAGKAEFFHRAGFTVTSLFALSDALIRHARENNVTEMGPNCPRNKIRGRRSFPWSRAG
jgi:hypothetical protein